MADPFADIQPIPMTPPQPMALQDALGGAGGGGMSPQAMRQLLAQMAGKAKTFRSLDSLPLREAMGLNQPPGKRQAAMSFDDTHYVDRTHAQAMERLLRDYPDAVGSIEERPGQHFGFMR